MAAQPPLRGAIWGDRQNGFVRVYGGPPGPLEAAHHAAALARRQASSLLVHHNQPNPFLLPIWTTPYGVAGADTGKNLHFDYSAGPQVADKFLEDRWEASRHEPCRVAYALAYWAVAPPVCNPGNSFCVLSEDPNPDDNLGGPREIVNPINPHQTLHWVRQHPAGHAQQGCLYCNCSDYFFRMRAGRRRHVCKHILTVYEHLNMSEYVNGRQFPIDPARSNFVP